MEHQLRVLVRLDIDQSSARLEVTGCLTGTNYRALIPIIRRAGSLVSGLGVIVDLNRARHIEDDGLNNLNQYCAELSDGEDGTRVVVAVPANLPECPALVRGRQAVAA